MKNYSNPSRKPMMYGGMAKPTKKMESGGRTVSDRDKEAMRQATKSTMFDTKKADDYKAQVRKLLSGRSPAKLTSAQMDMIRNAIKSGGLPDAMKEKAKKVLSTTDASTAKSYTPNDKKMYGGKAKKMAMGGKPMAKDPKTGKMMPTYAMDGKGKMMAGGKARKK